MAITAVVITHNSAALIGDHLASVTAALEFCGGDWEIVVVDSGSTDDTLERARASGVAEVASLDGNRGYGAGINRGIALGRHRDVVLILNPDTRLAPDSVSFLLAALERPSTGIAVPRLLDESGHTQRSLRREPTVRRALGEAVLGGRRAGRWPVLGEVVSDPDVYEHDGLADWATGAVMCVSRACLDRIGPWEESFFMYSEETDFALRARDAGFATRYVPQARVVHRGGEGNVSPKLYSVLTKNRVRLYRRRHGAVAAASFWSVVLIGVAARAARGSRPHRAAVRALFQPADQVIAAANGSVAG